ncbi:MAG TPA: HEAT repeat domain-containing protein, partial [Phototrophicaceae bacterium]|nr:HEAT repeat domain-containing protein [Phototrophicaceae bacterium]
MAPIKLVKPIDPYLADLNDPSYHVRRKAITQLAKTNNPDAIPYLIKALNDPYDSVHNNAIKMLSNFKDPQIMVGLVDHLLHQFAAPGYPVHFGRGKLVHDELATYGEEAVIPLLLPGLQSDNRYVRSSTAWLLEQFWTMRAISATDVV